MDFSIPLIQKKFSKTKTVYLNECIDCFFQTELLNDLYLCNKCNFKTYAKKQIMIGELPNILLIHLKRFKNDPKKHKINHKIEFLEQILDLSRYFILITII